MGCMQCPRKCNKERAEGDVSSYGYCQVSVRPKVARADDSFIPAFDGEGV